MRPNYGQLQSIIPALCLLSYLIPLPWTTVTPPTHSLTRWLAGQCSNYIPFGVGGTIHHRERVLNEMVINLYRGSKGQEQCCRVRRLYGKNKLLLYNLIRYRGAAINSVNFATHHSCTRTRRETTGRQCLTMIRSPQLLWTILELCTFWSGADLNMLVECFMEMQMKHFIGCDK